MDVATRGNGVQCLPKHMHVTTKYRTGEHKVRTTLITHGSHEDLGMEEGLLKS